MSIENKAAAVPASDTFVFPASLGQQRLWFLNQLEPHDPFYNIAITLKILGPLHIIALEASLNEVVRRHEILRTTFSIESVEPVQIVHPFQPSSLTVLDLRHSPESEREESALNLAKEQARRAFDLKYGPLLRSTLFRIAEEESILAIAIHHIIFDGWSQKVFFQELSSLYASFDVGKPSSLAELPLQYADYSIWQKELVKHPRVVKQLEYWKKQLAGIPPLLELQTDYPRPSIQSYRGARRSITVPETILNGLRALSREEQTTLFVILLSAFQTLLSRYTSQTDIVVGSPVAERNRTEIESLIGFFVNTLLFRSDLSGDPTFRELLKRVRTVAFTAYANQDLPFERLVDELHPERRPSHSTLFQVMLVMRTPETWLPQFPGLQTVRLELDIETAMFDLVLLAKEQNDKLDLTIEFNTALFLSETIEHLLANLKTLLEGIVANPDESISHLPILSRTEQQQLLIEWNATQTEYPRDKCIHQLFEEQVERTPDAVAVSFGDQVLTYGQLNRRANQLAHYLRRQGVGADVLVGLAIERSMEMLVGVVGILKAGGAYVPFDPEYPVDRLAFMVDDANTHVVLSSKRTRGSLPSGVDTLLLDQDWNLIARESTQNPPNQTLPNHLAYVLYTSGSTGKPKGVMMNHRPLVNLISWQICHPSFAKDGKTLQFASLNFDASFHEIFSTLCSGGTLVLISEQSRRDAGSLLQYLHDQTINRMFMPFIFLQQLAQEAVRNPIQVPSLTEIITAGEQLRITPEIRAWFKQISCTLHNHYGPTESHVVTAFTLDGSPDRWDAFPPIGQPIANTQIYILGNEKQLMPRGAIGEIFIGGDCLARRYLNRDDMTAERFIPHPFCDDPNARLYQTGDLARFLPDGNIVFLGRVDEQVKLRGYRIELGEIEVALQEHPSVRDCVVSAREDNPGDKRLIAYVVPHPNSTADDNEWRHLLRTKLPEYMVPSAFIKLDALPLSPNGKVDRRALPAPEIAVRRMEDAFVAPRDRFELALAEIWEAILRVSPIGMTDNFFDLGGHSLLAVRLFAEIEKIYSKKFPLRILFEAATIEQFAQLLQHEGWQPDWSSLVPIRAHGSKPPLFYIPPLNAVLSFAKLAYRLGSDQPTFGLLASPLGDHNPFTRMEDEAAFHIEQIRTVQPQGPYYLSGWSYGGLVAYEIAQQLVAQGERVAFLGILDTGFRLKDLRARVYYYSRLLKYFVRLRPREQFERVAKRIRMISRIIRHGSKPNEIMTGEIKGNDWKGDLRRMALYHPRPYPGGVVLFRTRDQDPRRTRDPLRDWGRLAKGGVEVQDIPGMHGDLLVEPHVQEVAEKFRTSLTCAQEQNQ